MASKLVEAGGSTSVIKSKKWAKSSDFYVNTHVLKSEAGDFVILKRGYCTYCSGRVGDICRPRRKKVESILILKIQDDFETK